MLTSVPLKLFLSLPKLFVKLAFNQREDLSALVEQLVGLADVARRDGSSGARSAAG